MMSEPIDQGERERLLEVLGLDKDASWETIQSTFIQLMTVWNPDRFHDDLKLKTRIRKKTSEIKIAFGRLEQIAGAYSRLEALENRDPMNTTDVLGFDLTKDLRVDSKKMCETKVFPLDPEQSDDTSAKKEEKKTHEMSTLLGAALKHDDIDSPETENKETRSSAQRVIRVLSWPFRIRNYISQAAYRFYLRLTSEYLFKLTLAMTAILWLAPKFRNFDINDFVASKIGSGQRGQTYDQAMFNKSPNNSPLPSYYSFDRSASAALPKFDWSGSSGLLNRIAPNGSQKPYEMDSTYKAAPAAYAPSGANQPPKPKSLFKTERKLAPGLYVYE